MNDNTNQNNHSNYGENVNAPDDDAHALSPEDVKLKEAIMLPKSKPANYHSSGPSDGIDDEGIPEVYLQADNLDELLAEELDDIGMESDLFGFLNDNSMNQPGNPAPTERVPNITARQPNYAENKVIRQPVRKNTHPPQNRLTPKQVTQKPHSINPRPVNSRPIQPLQTSSARPQVASKPPPTQGTHLRTAHRQTNNNNLHHRVSTQQELKEVQKLEARKTWAEQKALQARRNEQERRNAYLKDSHAPNQSHALPSLNRPLPNEPVRKEQVANDIEDSRSKIQDIQHRNYMIDLLRKLVERKGSDIIFTVGAAPAFKIDGELAPISFDVLDQKNCSALVKSIMNPKQVSEFSKTKESNFTINLERIGRFSCSVFMQKGHPGMVIHRLDNDIPNLEDMAMPDIAKNVICEKNGLILLTGAKGTGKSKTLAALIDYRNENTQGHIVTLEDKIKYTHSHKRSIVTQRELGIDTYHWESALKNIMRQAPNVIYLGIIKDSKFMDFALNLANLGHLVIASMATESVNETLNQLASFQTTQDARQRKLVSLSTNLRAIFCHQLETDEYDIKYVTLEMLVTSSQTKQLIQQDKLPVLEQFVERMPVNIVPI